MREAVHDASFGMHELTSGDLPKTALGLVVGENPDARVPRYHSADAQLPKRLRRIIGWEEVDPMPHFGDVVLFCQMNATNCSGLWKLPADTNAANEFALCDSTGRKIIRVPRMADIVVCDLEDMELQVEAMEELCMTA